MKRFFTIFAAVSMILAGCTKKSDFENLLNRVDSLEGQKITSVEGQISNINSSVSDLQTAKELIDSAISELKKDDGAIRSENQQLGKDIQEIKAYADSLSDGNVSWIEATFSTLKMMSEVQTRLETLEKLVPEFKTTLSKAEEAVKKWVGVQLEGYTTLAQLEAAITASEAKSKGWIAAVNDSVANLRKDLGTTKEQLTKDYQDAIKTAIEEYSGKVTKEIADQIKEAKNAADKDIKALQERTDGLESRIKAAEDAISKIEKQISDINASITATEASIKEIEETLDGKIIDLTTDLQLLKEDLEKVKKQLQDECASAIKTAIDEYSGKVTKEITDKIDAAKTALGPQISSITERLSALESRMAAVETKIADALGRIQSVTVVPNYMDGSVGIKLFSRTTVRFEISPASAAKALVENTDAKDFFSLQAVEARANATAQTGSVIGFTIESVAMDDNDEFVLVTLAQNPSINKNSSLLARLKIEANAGKGNYVCKTSDYFPFAPHITDLSSKGTANCYIVPKSGTFKFKATVKGNSNESVGIPASAEVLWEANGRSNPCFTKVGDMIKAMVLSDDYVFFETPDTLTNGNALIAVKDAEGTILWSWHIWICKGFDPVATAQVYYNNAGTLMDRNLGATSGEPGFLDRINEKPSGGLLYQWGRKDPFQGSGDAQQTATLDQLIIVSSDSSKGTIDYSVKHPTEFISYADNVIHDWLYTGSDNTRWQSTKTKYDPCPNGWRVPDGSVWATAFGTITEWKSYSSWDTENLGMNFGKTINKLGDYPVIWYPSTGKIGQTGRSEYAVSGGYWSVTPYPGTNGFATGLFIKNTGDVYPATDLPKAYGHSVRCMAEE